MLQDNILLVISLFFGIAFLVMLSEKLKISYPILLVISGLLISLVPGIPSISLHPDLVFLILFSSSFYHHCCMQQPGILPGVISGR
jgi:hypothetical protein